MQSLIVHPSKVRGEIDVPSSKSHTLRAILFGALGEGHTSVISPLDSPDAQAMVSACQQLGATIHWKETIEIEGMRAQIILAEDIIDAGNSGIVLRFLTAITALGNQPIVITGDHSIRSQRSMAPMLSGLQQLGVEATSTGNNGYAPLTIKGPLKGGNVVIDGADSQPVSALLIAGALTPLGINMTVNNVGEKPWIDLTLSWLRRLGVKVEHHNHTHFHVAGNQRWNGFHYQVPGDWSSAGFLLAAALVTGSELTIKNLDFDDCQGDKKLVTILQKMGADITKTSHSLHVRPKILRGATVDLNDCIDAITILSVIACYAEGTTTITNASVAREKECDRIACLVKELRKMGATIEETSDGLKIEGSPLKGAVVDSYQDHRMAMSLAIAGLGAKGETVVHDSACVAKTYPGFAKAMQGIGANFLEVF